MKLTANESALLNKLRENVECNNEFNPGFGIVYLDNAVPDGMSRITFRAVLSHLAAKGLYHKLDGYAFGSVRMADLN